MDLFMLDSRSPRPLEAAEELRRREEVRRFGADGTVKVGSKAARPGECAKRRDFNQAR